MAASITGPAPASQFFAVNDGALMLSLAVRGMGLIYTADAFAAREVAAGRLELTLE